MTKYNNKYWLALSASLATVALAHAAPQMNVVMNGALSQNALAIIDAADSLAPVNESDLKTFQGHQMTVSLHKQSYTTAGVTPKVQLSENNTHQILFSPFMDPSYINQDLLRYRISLMPPIPGDSKIRAVVNSYFHVCQIDQVQNKIQNCGDVRQDMPPIWHATPKHVSFQTCLTSIKATMGRETAPPPPH